MQTVLFLVCFLGFSLAQTTDYAALETLFKKAIGAETTQITVAQLPQNFPSIPLPSFEGIYGVVSQDNGMTNEPMEFTVYLKTAGSSNISSKIYSETLSQNGWQAIPDFGRENFVVDGEGAYDAQASDMIFCSPEGAALQFYPTKSEDSFTDYVLYINQFFIREQCKSAKVGSANPIPTIHLPQTTELFGVGSGSGETSYDANADLKSSLNGAELYSHVDAQLKEAGWLLRGKQPLLADSSTETISSLYTLTYNDESWIGYLWVQGGNTQSIFIRVVKED
ncbi:MAG: hypothetical protein KC422_20620 [Trueperaceae bacterium]|nr:hypothetical protein [Trueperaceae bacterium]